jgi:hypothetical protein
MYMENLVLSWAGEGRREASSATVGPSLATVWVVVWTGMEKLLAKTRSFLVVRTLFVGSGQRLVSFYRILPCLPGS